MDFNQVSLEIFVHRYNIFSLVRKTELEDGALARGRVDKRVRERRLREERQGAKLEEVTFDLDHLKKEKVRSRCM